MRLSMPGFGLILTAEFLGATGGDLTFFPLVIRDSWAANAWRPQADPQSGIAGRAISTTSQCSSSTVVWKTTPVLVNPRLSYRLRAAVLWA